MLTEILTSQITTKRGHIIIENNNKKILYDNAGLLSIDFFGADKSSNKNL